MTDREAMLLALDALENHTAIQHPQQMHYRDTAIEALRQALEQPEQEVSYTDIQMAELIMSDCGHSSDYKPLLDRIAGRLAKYRQALKQPDPVEEAVLAEREACAKACESIRPSKQEYDQRFYTACTLCANAIRARGE